MLMYHWSLPEMLRAPAKGLSGAQVSFKLRQNVLPKEGVC